MEIYIDESGLFAASNTSGSWSVVAAFAVPDQAVPNMELALMAAKTSIGCDINSEIKLKHFHRNEKAYFRFLHNIALLDGLIFATASDSSLNAPAAVLLHKDTQVKKVREHIAKMRYEEARQNIETISSKLGRLSLQLYTQLYCQVELIQDVVDYSINYFAQRYPKTLSVFKWRIDRSGPPPSAYEYAFEQMAPLLLQTISLTRPLCKFKSPDFDYSHLEQFEMMMPAFLKDDYNIELTTDRGLDLQQVIRGDMEFVDSSKSVGVQVVDLIVSGLRRCLQRGFNDNEKAAAMLGQLMVQHQKNEVPIKLVCFRKDRPFLDKKTEKIVNIMRATAKGMSRRQ